MNVTSSSYRDTQRVDYLKVSAFLLLAAVTATAMAGRHWSLALLSAAAAMSLLPPAILPGLSVLALSLGRVLAPASDASLESLSLGVVVAYLILALWLLRNMAKILHTTGSIRAPGLVWLLVAVCLLSVSTFVAGITVTVLVHFWVLFSIVLAGGAGAHVSRAGLLGSVLVAVVVESFLTLEGAQSRLLGSDPAQLGFLAVVLWILAESARSMIAMAFLRSLALVVIILTQTRSVQLAFFTVVLLQLTRARRPVTWIGISAGAVAVGFLSVGLLTNLQGLNEFSIEIRRVSIMEALSLIYDRPILGWGWGGAAEATGVFSDLGVSSGYVVYNSLLGWAVAAGVPSMVALVVFFFRSLRFAVRADRQVALVVTAFLVQGLVEMNLFPGGTSSLIVFISLAMSANNWRIGLRETSPVSRPAPDRGGSSAGRDVKAAMP